MGWSLGKFLQNRINWLRRTPERAVYEAFQSAIKIKKIEDEFFNGQPIADTAGYTPNAYSLFRFQLQKNLQNIRLRLAEYRVSASLPFTLNTGIIKVSQPLKNPEENAPLLQQLAFIDYILKRYQVSPQTETTPNPEPVKLLDDSLTQANDNPNRFTLLSPSPAEKKRNAPSITPVEKTIIPGSFFRTFERIRRTVTNDYFGYERDFVDELRQSRRRSTAALKYLGLLTVIFIGTQVLTKNLVFSPLVDSWFGSRDNKISFSPALQERAFMEYRLARDRAEFQNIINEITDQPEERKQETNAEMRRELKRILITYNQRSLEGLKNLGADISAILALYITLINTRRQLALIKEFIDEVLYSLNDSAKAFMIIVATDTFVGFHSSDGWDALFFVIFSHFGLPENRILTKAFIATVPVFLDGLFKFWIFQYLRQSSPSTAAIFNEMNQ